METTLERMRDQADYRAYLLRLWRESSTAETQGGPATSPQPEGWVWRASLETPQAGERKGFACLEDLFAFLRQQTSLQSDMDRDSAT